MLLVADPSALRTHVEQTLSQAHKTTTTSFDNDDLFGAAIKHKAIVYIPSPLLNASLAPAPEPARARRIVGASRAPGVELIVVVLLQGSAYDAEENVFRREGKPFLIIKAPLLIEEVAEVLQLDRGLSVWVPNTGSIMAAKAESVSQKIMEALETEHQGRTLLVEGDTLTLPVLLQQAAACTAGVTIHSVSPTLFKMARPVVRWFKKTEPQSLGLCDKLAPA